MKTKNILLLSIATFSFSISAQGLAQESIDSVSMSSVVVTASGSVEQDIESAPASMTVITKQDIDKQPVRDISDVLRFTEGVMLTGANDRGISLRGFDSSYTLVLVNGKRMSSRFLSVRHNADADLSWISPSDIERIEIVRGPMATLYGADAIGGVINIITKKIPKAWYGSVDTSVTVSEEQEQKNLSQTNASVAGPLIQEKLSLRLGARKSERPRPEFATTDSRQYAGQDKTSFTSGVVWSVNPNHELSFDVDKSQDEQQSLYRGAVTVTTIDRTNLGLDYRGTFGRYKTEINIFRDQYDYETGGDPAKLWNDSLHTKLQWPGFGDAHYFVAGAEVEKFTLENETQLTTGETSFSQVSAFLEDSIQVTSQSVVTLGLRSTDHEKFGNHLSPRAYLVHNSTPELTYKAGVGTGYKPPTLLELAEDFNLPSCRGACTMIGNPNLKPESSVSYEVGAYYKTTNWSLNGTLYYSELKDMIATYFDTINGQDYRLLHNIDNARTQGVELGTKYLVSPFVTLGLNGTYTDARNLSQDTVLSNIPKGVANFIIDWSVQERLSTYLVTSYTGERTIASTTGENTVSGYTLFNAGLKYDLPKRWLEGANVNFGIENLTNHLLSNEYGYGEMGRRYFVKLAVGFGGTDRSAL